jgi:hypothetical protein
MVERCAGASSGITAVHVTASDVGLSSDDAPIANDAKVDTDPEKARMPIVFQPRTVTVREALLENMTSAGADLVGSD